MGAFKQMWLEQMDEEAQAEPGHFCQVCDEPLTKEEVDYCGGLCSYHHYAVEKMTAED
jgi:hypothetical protein